MNLPSIPWVCESSIDPGMWSGYVASEPSDNVRIHFTTGRYGALWVNLFVGSALVHSF